MWKKNLPLFWGKCIKNFFKVHQVCVLYLIGPFGRIFWNSFLPNDLSYNFVYSYLQILPPDYLKKETARSFWKLCLVQGVSTGIDILWRPQRPTKNNFLVKMEVAVYFWGLGNWLSSIIFQKSNIGWPHQPPSERVPYISEKVDFWSPIPQKMTSIDHFGASDDQKIRIFNFLRK